MVGSQEGRRAHRSRVKTPASNFFSHELSVTSLLQRRILGRNSLPHLIEREWLAVLGVVQASTLRVELVSLWAHHELVLGRRRGLHAVARLKESMRVVLGAVLALDPAENIGRRRAKQQAAIAGKGTQLGS